MKREHTYLPSAKKIFERYEKASSKENILLVGAVGAGKSATINTITAALSGEKKYRAPIGAQHATTESTRRRTTTHLIWYDQCGIDENRRKDMHAPRHIPNLVDMTGLDDVHSRDQEELLEMIIKGKIPDRTSIPALQDLQRKRGKPGALNRYFPFMYGPRRIHKILFVATATDPIPKRLIESVKNVAQPDGSSSNLNPRYIPIFGLLTKEDLVNWEDADTQDKEREFLQCLGIDAAASYSRWKNTSSGDYSSSVLYFLDKLLSPDVRTVLDPVIFFKRWAGSIWEKPVYILPITLLPVCFGLFMFFVFETFLPDNEFLGFLFSSIQKKGDLK